MTMTIPATFLLFVVSLGVLPLSDSHHYQTVRAEAPNPYN